MINQESQSEIWDAIAPSWHAFRQKPIPEIAGLLKSLAEKWRRGRILEVGCGNCRNLLYFSYNDFDCYGIDFSRNMLSMAEKYCRKHDLNVKLKHGMATEIPFQERSFDYVIVMSMLHHLNEEDRTKALQEVKRVLKSGGKAVITVWNKLQPRFILKSKDVYVPWHIGDKTYNRYYHLFTSFELSNVLKKAGFKILQGNTFGRNLVFVVEK